MSLKFIALIPFLFVIQNISAQTFSEVSGTPFEDIEGSIAFADVDGDNDQDVLLAGSNDAGRVTKLYINDGLGNFSEVSGTPFEDIVGSIAFADVDRDNDQDVLLSGIHGTGESISVMYSNDGQGNFSKALDTTLYNVDGSAVAFADVDKDNDKDLLLSGTNYNSPPINPSVSKLYTNDGQGNFTEAVGTPFDDVLSIAFADVDGDNDQDVLLTKDSSGKSISKLYTNDGQGNFSEVSGTPFEDVEFGSVGFADVDGDNDQDVLITGNNGSDNISKLYTNDGQGNFSEVMGTPFVGVRYSSIAFADVDGDNDHDVLLSGRSSGYSISKLYINDGQGNFNEVPGTPFDDVMSSSIAFADVDGDNDQDVLLTGRSSNGPISKLYINQQNDVSVRDDLTRRSSIDVLPYPNPTKGRHLHVRYNALENGDVHVNVYGLNGDLLRQHKVSAVTGKQTLSIDLPSLAQGSYILELQQGKQKGFAKFTVH